jgi:hypothetical protein
MTVNPSNGRDCERVKRIRRSFLTGSPLSLEDAAFVDDNFRFLGRYPLWSKVLSWSAIVYFAVLAVRGLFFSHGHGSRWISVAIDIAFVLIGVGVTLMEARFERVLRRSRG